MGCVNDQDREINTDLVVITKVVAWGVGSGGPT